MKTLLLLLIFIGLCLLRYPAMNIRHHPEANDHSSLRRRLKRSGTYEEPLQVSQKKAYLQTGHAYELPCTVIRPGDSVSIVFWLRGESLDPALRDVILRQAYPNDGLNFVVDDRYQISSAYGIIIDPVNMTDTNRYWCKTVRKPSNQFVEDYLDVTVIDKTFPKDDDSIVDETSVSLSIESENAIQCPLLPQAPTQIKSTVYWSILTDNVRSLDIMFAKFANGDTLLIQEYVGTHGPQGNNGLVIRKFKRRDERYCCHVFEQGDDLRTACIDVTWLALATARRPAILDCDTIEESCEVGISPHQNCLHLECSLNEVYPKPTLNWSYTNCVKSPTFFTTSSSTGNREVFNIRSTVYVVDLQTSLDGCSLVCTAHGEAIPDQMKPASVAITRLAETITSQMVRSTCTNPGCNFSGFIFLAFFYIVLFLLIIVMLKNPQSLKCIHNCVGGIPNFCWFPEQCAERHRSSIDSPEEDEELTPVVTIEGEEKGDADEKKDEGCLANRGSEEVDITDMDFIWDYLGQLVTNSVLAEENVSGFQAIIDVIGIQDGGVVVIDSKGLHLFTTEYHYRFIDLYKAFGDKCYICVAFFADNELLFGLRWGKLVIFDIANQQVNNFGSVTPVKDTIVQLNGIAVNSGFVLASDETGKTISVFDREGVCFKRLDTPSFQPGSLALHIRKETPSFFVTSGDVVRKYYIYGSEKGQSKITHTLHFDIDKNSLATIEFKPGHISVQENKLSVVNHLDDSDLLQILKLDINNGTFKQSIIAKAPGIHGVKFISGNRIVLYTGDSVHVFEKGNAKKKLRSKSAGPLASPRLTQKAAVEAARGTGPFWGSLPPGVAAASIHTADAVA